MERVGDRVGGRRDRRYFKTEVLDERCERKIAEFMDRHCGGFRLPIPTSGIIRMIAAEAKLELHADLAEGVDGYTDYFTDGKPNVKISERLSSARYENRFRFTLGHEYGHVWFHAPLWRKSGLETDRRPAEPCWTCHRETIGTAPEKDWMEWQAEHSWGPRLMPRPYAPGWAGAIEMRESSNPPGHVDCGLGQAESERR